MSQIDAGHQSGHHGGHGSDDSLSPKIVDGFDGVVTRQPDPAPHGVGPVMTDDAYEAYLAKLGANPMLSDDNVRVSEVSAGLIGRGLLIAGVACLVLTLLLVLGGFGRHALAAYQVGVFTVLACCLGALFLTMVTHMMNAYWSATVRRQLENIASLVWVPVLMLVPVVLIEVISGGVLLQWLNPELQGTFLIEHKEGYLNPVAFVVRFMIYAMVWIYLSRRLYLLSRDQDVTGDRWLTRRMRRLSGVGLLLFALTVPFAAFDFLMSMDYRFFSTMWGVYYFAGAAMSGAALAAVVLAVLRTFGRLNGVVTKEHFHDLGKLLFAFTVFWAYISFSQYFLIWYSNIPEETAYYLQRTTAEWKPLFVIIMVGHFIVPFFILISRQTKKSTLGLAAMGAWLLFMQVLDMVFVIRPMVYIGEHVGGGGLATWGIDVLAVVGVAGVFGGLLVRMIASGPLIPVRDPRLAVSLKHKNYV